MFEHSIKVPRLYKTAAKIAQKVKEDGSSLKQLVYEKKHPNVKALYALVLQTLQNDDNLNAIIRHSQILTKENRLDPWLARVLITELLFGKKQLPGESKPIKTVISYKDEFLKDFTPENKTKNKTKKIIKPKYVRVNTLKISVEEVIDNFRNDGWSLVWCGDGSDYSAFLATSASLSEEQFMVDTLIKDLLIFPPGSQFYEHKLYKNGCFVLQDKASCLAPFLLNPTEGSTILDMCAAPGMKCMQLASMIGETGKIYAVERDQRRYETLKTLLAAADANHVTTINRDVLTLNDNDVPDVEYILVDPSCSGSGITDRIEFEDETSHCNESRLQKLAGFQITILRHALNNFKSVKRIIYSTCSIFPQENEQVVQQAITTTPDFKLVSLNEQLKEKWYNFGSTEYDIGPRCLYAKPEIDRTNGFFIAVFDRLKEGETNEFFIKRVQRTSECENIDNEKPKKGKKKKKLSEMEHNIKETEDNLKNNENVIDIQNGGAKVKKNKTKGKIDANDVFLENEAHTLKKKKKKDKELDFNIKFENKNEPDVEKVKTKKKKNKKRKDDNLSTEIVENCISALDEGPIEENDKKSKKKQKKIDGLDQIKHDIINEETDRGKTVLISEENIQIEFNKGSRNSDVRKKHKSKKSKYKDCENNLQIEIVDTKKCKKRHRDKEKVEEIDESVDKTHKKKKKKVKISIEVKMPE